jgi:membrane protein insertase Oxa1/YidC/SpoIIIJ
MIMAFRAMAVVMVPAIMYFPTSVLCYWVPNNFLTMVQSIVLRNDKVKKTFGIWERPKPVPGSQSDMGFQETMTKLVKQVKGEPTTEKEKIQKHNKEVLVKKRVQSMSKNARNTR